MSEWEMPRELVPISNETLRAEREALHADLEIVQGIRDRLMADNAELRAELVRTHLRLRGSEELRRTAERRLEITERMRQRMRAVALRHAGQIRHLRLYLVHAHRP